jgi:protein arginine kinase activator
MTTVVENDVKRMDLCEECARKAGAIHPSGFLAEEAFFQSPTAGGSPSLQCVECGYPLESLQKTGRLGCASCYSRFAESLQEALVESQKGLVHRGKQPVRNQAGEEELAAEMRQLIAQEDFEGAARLRDQIAAKKKAVPRRRRSS